MEVTLPFPFLALPSSANSSLTSHASDGWLVGCAPSVLRAGIFNGARTGHLLIFPVSPRELHRRSLLLETSSTKYKLYMQIVICKLLVSDWYMQFTVVRQYSTVAFITIKLSQIKLVF
jgi:hypothetical protein